MDVPVDGNDVFIKCSVTSMMLVMLNSNELAMKMRIVAIEIIMLTMIKATTIINIM